MKGNNKKSESNTTEIEYQRRETPTHEQIKQTKQKQYTKWDNYLHNERNNTQTKPKRVQQKNEHDET